MANTPKRDAIGLSLFLGGIIWSAGGALLADAYNVASWDISGPVRALMVLVNLAGIPMMVAGVILLISSDKLRQ